jgi:hypothetical protein
MINAYLDPCQPELTCGDLCDVSWLNQARRFWTDLSWPELIMRWSLLILNVPTWADLWWPELTKADTSPWTERSGLWDNLWIDSQWWSAHTTILCHLKRTWLDCSALSSFPELTWVDLIWNSWTEFSVEVSGHINSSFLRLEFLSGFLPSFIPSTKCYSWKDSKFLVLRIFFVWNFKTI